MKKVLKDSKQLLFENMMKINSDFKLSENVKKIINNNISKKSINEEIGNINFEPNNPDYKIKIDKIKAVIDELFDNQDYDIIDTIYRLFVDRSQPKITPKPVGQSINEANISDYNKKAALLKGKIDFLLHNNHLDIIDKVDEILTKLFPMGNDTEMN